MKWDGLAIFRQIEIIEFNAHGLTRPNNIVVFLSTGDTPIVGAGNYANHLCAVSATGRGEAIMKATVGREVAAIMEYKNASLAEAAEEVVVKRLPKGMGGLVAVSATGDVVMPFNTTGMFRACVKEGGTSEIGIWL